MGPYLVLLTGHPAAGKSTLARPLAEALGAACLSKDQIRYRVFDGWRPEHPVFSGAELSAGGAVFEEAEDLDVAAIPAGFLKGARAAGAMFRLDAEVTNLDRTAGRWTIKLRDGEAISAANLVNAAGAWADVVAGFAGAKPVGLVPK